LPCFHFRVLDEVLDQVGEVRGDRIDERCVRPPADSDLARAPTRSLPAALDPKSIRKPCVTP
jgi:hypothetical protein